MLVNLPVNGTNFTRYFAILLFLKVVNLFEVLYTSQNDRRFGQFLSCFEILFNYSSAEIFREYHEIRKGKFYNYREPNRKIRLIPFLRCKLLKFETLIN